MRHATLILAAAAALLLPAAGARADDDRYDDDRRAEIDREYLQRRAELERDYQKALREQRRDDARRYEEAMRRDRERYERDRGRTTHVVRREAYDRYRDVAPPVLVGPSGARLGYRGYTPDGPVTYAPGYAPPPSYGWDAYGPAGAGAGGYLPPVDLPPAEVPVQVPPAPAGAGPVAQHAALLTSQIDSFIQVFAPTAGVVPEGGAFLREAQGLAAASRSFQALLAQGADPAALADSFRAVEATWSRLARRTERVAKGRSGPNIQQIQFMGTTLEAIRRDWPY